MSPKRMAGVAASQGEAMSLDVVVIQHAEEIPVPGDHGITEAGREQARAVGLYLHGYGPFDECWTSPLMRARRTARLVSGEVDLRDPTLHEDARLSERLNWSSEQACARDAFRAEWLRTTRDRGEPRRGHPGPGTDMVW
jgi:broad specificity phosphatase PhoE